MPHEFNEYKLMTCKNRNNVKIKSEQNFCDCVRSGSFLSVRNFIEEAFCAWMPCK